MVERSCREGSDEDAGRYAELAIGAEFLAAISGSAEERIEHLRMAGLYHQRSRQAGGPAGPACLQ